MDYPAHLVRVTLLSNLPLDPAVARYWTAGLRPVANLGMDLFVPAIAPLTGPVAGLKIFATMGLALWIAGAALLFRGLWGRLDAQALLSAPFAFNVPFSFGFFNFHFGAGLALCGTGLWLIRRQRSFLFLALMAGLALILLFCHLMTLAILALFLGGVELGRLFSQGFTPARALYAARDGLIVFLPSALVWAIWIEHGEGGPLAFDFWTNIKGPVSLSSALGGPTHVLPAILLIFSWLAAWRAGRLQAAPEGIALLLVIWVASLLMPSAALGGDGANVRMSALLVIAALSALAVDWPRLTRLPKPWLLAGFFALLAVSSIITINNWRTAAAGFAELRRLNAAHLPKEARLVTAFAENTPAYAWHVSDLAIIDREAFVPAFFATPGQSTIRLTQDYAAIGAVNAYEGAPLRLPEVRMLLSGGMDGLDARSRSWLRPYRMLACDFDYLLVIGNPTGNLPGEFLLIAAEPHGSLYRIAPRPDRRCPQRPVPSDLIGDSKF
jgi:hypothetical protein